MYVIGKDTLTERVRRNVDAMELVDQKDYYFRNKSWLAYFVTCWKLGEITTEELLDKKMKVIKGEIK